MENLKQTDVDTSRWKDITSWVDWSSVMCKLTAAYSSLSFEDWDDLPATTNPIKSINRQSVPPNTKSVSLKPLIEHFHLYRG